MKSIQVRLQKETMKNCNLSFNYLRAKKYLNGKHLSLIFVSLFIAAIVPFVSYKSTNNFWYILSNSFKDITGNLIFMFTLGLNLIKFLDKEDTSILCNRYGTIRKKMVNDLMCIIIMTSVFFLTFFILNIAFSLLGAFDDFAILNHQNYNIPYPIYTVFVIFRYYVFMILFAIITYIVALSKNKIISSLLMSGILMLLLIPVNTRIIDKLTEIPLLFTAYISNVTFSSFSKEILYSFIIILIYIIIVSIILEYRKGKKVDI